MHDSVAFIAAPYGFGPTSKAIAISSYLPRWIKKVFLSDGPPLELAKQSNEFSTTARLNFACDADCAAERLSEYEVLVFVNSTRFIEASSKVAESVIFVDTLAWLRDSRPKCHDLLDSYFAQRFFQHPFSPDLMALENFQPVGAIIPKRAPKKVRERCFEIHKKRRSPLIHCGGLCSPAMLPGADTAFVETMLACFSSETPMRIILPRHLHAEVVGYSRSNLTLIECSPVTVQEHIEDSPVSLTTSGIEFTYESLSLGVPILFLPPFNATQYLQLDYHLKQIDHVVPFDLGEQTDLNFDSLDEKTTLLQKQGVNGEWRRQFEEVARRWTDISLNRGGSSLEDLRKDQMTFVSRVGDDGAQTIAEYLTRRIHRREAIG